MNEIDGPPLNVNGHYDTTLSFVLFFKTLINYLLIPKNK